MRRLPRTVRVTSCLVASLLLGGTLDAASDAAARRQRAKATVTQTIVVATTPPSQRVGVNDVWFWQENGYHPYQESAARLLRASLGAWTTCKLLPHPGQWVVQYEHAITITLVGGARCKAHATPAEQSQVLSLEGHAGARVWTDAGAFTIGAPYRSLPIRLRVGLHLVNTTIVPGTRTTTRTVGLGLFDFYWPDRRQPVLHHPENAAFLLTIEHGIVTRFRSLTPRSI